MNTKQEFVDTAEVQLATGMKPNTACSAMSTTRKCGSARTPAYSDAFVLLGGAVGFYGDKMADDYEKGAPHETPWYVNAIAISETTRFGIVAETLWWAFLLTLVVGAVALATLAAFGMLGWFL